MQNEAPDAGEGGGDGMVTRQPGRGKANETPGKEFLRPGSRRGIDNPHEA